MRLENFCLVLDDFLEPSLIDEAYLSIREQDFNAFFVKKEDVRTGKNYIYDIIHQTWTKKLSFFENIVGFEVWSNLMTPDNVLDLHCDVYEYHHDLTGEVIHPLYTSVLYLGPKNQIEGGELRMSLKHTDADILLPQGYQKVDEEGRAEKTNHDWISVPFRYNRLVVFDPKRPHLITNIKSGASKEHPRIGLTMAAWDSEITITQ